MIHIKSLNCRGGSMRWQLKCTTIISFCRDYYEQKETNRQTIAILRISWQHQVRGRQWRVPGEQFGHKWKTTSFISLCAAFYCFKKFLGLFTSCDHSKIGLFFNKPFLKSFTFECFFGKFCDQVHSSCSQGFHVCVLQGFFV